MIVEPTPHDHEPLEGAGGALDHFLHMIIEGVREDPLELAGVLVVLFILGWGWKRFRRPNRR